MWLLIKRAEVEGSAPVGSPGWGGRCWPQSWPQTHHSWCIPAHPRDVSCTFWQKSRLGDKQEHFGDDWDRQEAPSTSQVSTPACAFVKRNVNVKPSSDSPREFQEEWGFPRGQIKGYWPTKKIVQMYKMYNVFAGKFARTIEASNSIRPERNAQRRRQWSSTQVW